MRTLDFILIEMGSHQRFVCLFVYSPESSASSMTLFLTPGGIFSATSLYITILPIHGVLEGLEQSCDTMVLASGLTVDSRQIQVI